MRIDIWSDIACPWCFIGKRRFEAALDAFAHRDEVDVEWHSFQLDPTLPTRADGSEADYLSRSKGMALDQVEQMFRHVEAQAAGEGLRFDFDSVVVANSFTAHRLLQLAKAQGVGGEAKEALLSGHFEQGRDISDHDYLAEVGQEVGIDPALIRRVLDSDEFVAEVEADIAEARALGIGGVPFFVIDRRYGISGAQPSAVFAEALGTAWQESGKLSVLAGDPSGPESTSGAVCGPEGCD